MDFDLKLVIPDILNEFAFGAHMAHPFGWWALLADSPPLGDQKGGSI